MKQTILKYFSAYGMVFVLFLLCVFFSAVTYKEQSPIGAVAGVDLASSIVAQFGKNVRVLIVVRDLDLDRDLADSLELRITRGGGTVVDTVRGEPKDAREALVRINESSQSVDVIACTKLASEWLVFSDLKNDYPKIGTPALMTPEVYYWPSFLKRENLLNIANQIAVIAIVAIGMTFVIITGGIDLSVGSLIALSAVLAAAFIRDIAGGMNATALGMTASCLAAIAICGLVGAFTGWMITQFDIPPFIVTLSMMLVSSGAAYLTSHSQSIYEIPDSFVWLGRESTLLGLPNAVVLMLVLYVVAHIVMSKMRLGRYIYAVGGNREAARLSGVPVERVLITAYILSAVLAALGGVIMASQLKSGSPVYGNMYELYVIAAVVVGGASLSGGEGKVFGTLVGAFTIAVIQNGMNLTNIESHTQKIVLGLMILGAVLIDRIKKH